MSLQIGQRVRIISVANPANKHWVGRESHITHIYPAEEYSYGIPMYVLAFTKTLCFMEEQLQLVIPDGAKAGSWTTLLDIWVPEDIAEKIKKPQG